MEHSSSLLFITALVFLVSFILVVRSAFHQGLAWGFMVLLFSPLSTIILGIVHWHDVKKSFLFFMAALGLYAYLFMQQFTSHGGMEVVDSLNEITQLSLQQQQGKLSQDEAQQQMKQMMARLSNRLDESVTRLKDSGLISEAELAQYRERVARQSPIGDYPAPLTPNDDMNEQPGAIKPANSTGSVKEKTLLDIVQEKKQQRERQRVLEQESIKTLHDKIRSKKNVATAEKTIRLKDISKYIGSELVVHDNNNLTHTGIMYKATDEYLQLYKELHGGRFDFQIEKQNIRQIRLSNNNSKR